MSAAVRAAMISDEMNKDKIVQVRITHDEYERWVATAEADDRTLSNWIRRQCNAAAVDQETIDLVAKEKAKREAAKKGKR